MNQTAPAIALGSLVRPHLATEGPGRVSHGRDASLARDNADLARRVDRLTAAGASNGRLVEQLVAAGRRKDEFLAMLGHELRHPLGPLQAAAAVLSRPGVEPAQVLRAQSILDRQVRQMTRLIDDLLDAARITQGKLEVHASPLDLRAVLTTVVDAAESLVRDRGQSVHVVLPVGPTMVLGDAGRLEQVFTNLVSNASKFSGPGRRIGVSVGPGPRIGPHPGAGQVVVRVVDQGIGIAAAALPRIFGLFEQVANFPQGASGLGVGLALARRIVHLHGGTIDVESAGLGAGAVFVVSLPALTAPPIAPRAGPDRDGV